MCCKIFLGPWTEMLTLGDGFRVGDQPRGGDGACKKETDNSQGPMDGKLSTKEIIKPAHLKPDKNKDQAQCILEIAKAVYDIGQHKVHGAKTKDRKNV